MKPALIWFCMGSFGVPIAIPSHPMFQNVSWEFMVRNLKFAQW
jgi:hypothetical protein